MNDLVHRTRLDKELVVQLATRSGVYTSKVHVPVSLELVKGFKD
jgi:hypothetical protein